MLSRVISSHSTCVSSLLCDVFVSLLVQRDDENFVDVVFTFRTSFSKIKRLVQMLFEFLAFVFNKCAIECSLRMCSA